MTDIIWGNGSDVISDNSFVLSVTHRKSGNKLDYSDTEEIKIASADLPGFSHDQNQWSKESLRPCVIDAFLKCEVERRDESGAIIAKVSHSGVGGY